MLVYPYFHTDFKCLIVETFSSNKDLHLYLNIKTGKLKQKLGVLGNRLNAWNCHQSACFLGDPNAQTKMAGKIKMWLKSYILHRRKCLSEHRSWWLQAIFIWLDIIIIKQKRLWKYVTSFYVAIHTIKLLIYCNLDIQIVKNKQD